jgi:hypothetical protein
MRVRITRPPSPANIDGISLWRYKVGYVYALPVPLATLMIVEGWAVPALDSSDVTLPPIKFRVEPRPERRVRLYSNRRLRTELGIAADRRRGSKN